MANIPGPQPEIKYCPICKNNLRNVPRDEMKNHYTKVDGTISPYTHTYTCRECGTRFEINQQR